MLACRFGGSEGRTLTFVDEQDLVVVRAQRRDVAGDVELAVSTREAQEELRPLFQAAAATVYEAPKGASERLAELIDADPEVRFAGRGLRDQYGAPVVYTENLFVKFADDVDEAAAREVLASLGLEVKRPLSYATGAFFVAAPERSGREVFAYAEQLLDRPDVELCHPELLREISWNASFPQQWHLADAQIGGRLVQAHANVVSAWELSDGDGAVIAILDDGFDLDHAEFATPGKIVAPRSFRGAGGNDPRPGPGDNHGTACAGVACADGSRGASGVAPKARLMPVRMPNALGTQQEADAFAWAADHGADVISCSWGPADGDWRDPDDPAHGDVVPLGDATRLAIEYALRTGRGGKGCVITWAAGNGNESVDNDGYASHPGVIAVAACNDVGGKSRYSDFGDAIWCTFPSSNGSPSLTPGIWTTDRSGTLGYNPGDASSGDAQGDYTNRFGGTSSACPGVAGVAALMLAANPALTHVEVREALRDSCVRIDDRPGEYDGQGRSANYGYGRVDARAAVEAAIR